MTTDQPTSNKETVAAVDPNSTTFEVLLMLYDYSEYAFNPQEIGTKIGSEHTTVQNALEQLLEQELIEQMDDVEGYYHALDDPRTDTAIRSQFTDGELEAKQRARGQFEES